MGKHTYGWLWNDLKVEITELETNETLEIDPVIKLVILVKIRVPWTPTLSSSREKIGTTTRPMDDTKITCHLGLKLLLGNQPIPSHYQFLCLLINTAIEPKWTKNLTRPPSVVTFVGENELEKHFEQAYFRVVRFLNCIIFLYIFVWTIEIITSSFQNSQGQKLPRNQRRLIPDAWKKETISTTERYGIFITNNLPAINYIPPNTWSVTTIRRLAWRSTEKIRQNNPEAHGNPIEIYKRNWLYMN